MTSEYQIEIGKSVFNDAYYPHLDLRTRIQIYFGGASSGKSVFIAERCIRDLLRGGRNYLCVRKVQRDIRQSSFTELCRAIDRFKCKGLFKVNRSDLTITCINGYAAMCKGLDDVEKVKSIVPSKGVLTDVWAEEATQCTQDDLRQLSKRLRGKADGVRKRITMTFNPILKSHWIYKTFFSGRFSDTDTRYQDDELFILKTTYKDNRWLEEDDIQALLAEKDSYYYDVYTLGNWGTLGDLVFKNWRVEPVVESGVYRTFDIFKNGLDFGYSNDPTAGVRCYYHRGQRRLYICHEYRCLGNTNDQIAADIEPIFGEDLVVCDSAEPKSIAELCNHGINAQGAVKGKDSILFGIQWLQQQEIVIDPACIYTIGNFEQYHWKQDKDGNVLNIPVDRDNDFIDAIRYAFEDEMLEGDTTIGGIGTAESSLADW